VRAAKWIVLIVAGWMIGCAGEGDSSGGDRGAGTPSGVGDSGDGSGSGPGISGVPSGGGTFSNPTGPAPNLTPQPTNTDDGTAGGMSTDPSACVAGTFCEAASPDPDNCGTLFFEPDVEITREPGNLLVVFDQSGSMDQNWGNTSKLQAAQSALVGAITPLQDDLTVGAVFFPTYDCIPFLPPPAGTGAVAPIDGAGQIPFQPGPQFLTAWQQHWTQPRTGLGIGTPMQEAFDRADAAIQSSMLTGNLAVVAFTDGEPNCFPDPNISGPTMVEPMRAASWLNDLSVQTHVVGLPGANGVAILDQVAQSGGTMSYVLPDDPAQLEAILSQVVEEQVKTGFNSCSMSLDPVPDVPDELLMIVEEPGMGTQQVPRDRGWSLAVDSAEARVEITGNLCDAATSGRFSSITFQYACPEAEPPPPLPPLE
jgi:hypothetical protein